MPDTDEVHNNNLPLPTTKRGHTSIPSEPLQRGVSSASAGATIYQKGFMRCTILELVSKTSTNAEIENECPTS